MGLRAEWFMDVRNRIAKRDMFLIEYGPSVSKPCEFKAREPDVLSSIVEDSIQYHPVHVTGCIARQLKGSKMHGVRKDDPDI